MRGAPIFWFSLLLAALFVSTRVCAEPAPLRSASDLRDLARLAAVHPEALELFKEGDALLARGEAQEAARRFRRGSELAPESALLLRRQCQALTWAGYRGDALEACRKAISASPTGTSVPLRAAVAALMWTTPTLDELGQALTYARLAVERGANQPWGYAARCDIAFRLGEPTMFEKCKQQLLTLAPDHYETQRVGEWDFARTSLAVFAAWGAVALLALYSLAHALLRTFSLWRGRGRARLRASGVALALVLPLFSLPARAEESSEKVAPVGGIGKWSVNLKDPVASVPSPADRDGNPVEYGYHLMDLADLTSQAVQRGDHAQAAKLAEAMVKAVPDAAGGYRRACEFNEKAGDPARALGFCRMALGVDGVVVEDYERYSRLVFAQSAPLKQEQIDDLTGIIQHLKSEAKAEGPAAVVMCQLAARLDDRKGLESCTAVLEKVAPKDPKTISFQWTLALLRGDLDRAQNLIVLAKQSNMPPEGVQTMEKAVHAELGWRRRLQRNWPVFLLLGVGGLLVVGVSLSLRRRGKVAVGGLEAS